MAEPQRLASLIQPEAIDASELSHGERKTVTALFADIKGSTELMRDPEEARAIVDPALKLMIDAMRRYDSYVVQLTGDGISELAALTAEQFMLDRELFVRRAGAPLGGLRSHSVRQALER